MKRLAVLSAVVVLVGCGGSNVKQTISYDRSISSTQTVTCCEYLGASDWTCEGNFFYKYCEHISEVCKGALLEEAKVVAEIRLMDLPPEGYYCTQIPVACNYGFPCSNGRHCANIGTIHAECVECVSHNHCASPMYCGADNTCKMPECVTDDECPDRHDCEGFGDNRGCYPEPTYPYIRPNRGHIDAVLQRLCEAIKLHQAAALEAPELEENVSIEEDIKQLEQICD